MMMRLHTPSMLPGSPQRKETGVTLLELMIVVAIIAIISSFAYPTYVDYVARTKRTAATSALMQIADRQQQYFMDRKTYASDLTDLGYQSDPLIILDNGNSSVATNLDSIYSISLSGVETTSFLLTAAPMHGQQKRDASCGNLTLDEAGTQGSAGANCWN